jgi:hypothetical protein
MGEIIPVNINLYTPPAVITQAELINWDEADFTWDEFFGDDYYAAYLYEAFEIEIPPPFAILWDHAVILTVVFPSGYDTSAQQGERKKRKKKIKIIFMMDDLTKVIEKEKNNLVKAEFKDKVENILTEKLGQKVVLENVQIIHR